MGKLDGRVAIITGAGSGMGTAGGRPFAEEGAKVVVAGIDAERGEAAAIRAERFLLREMADAAESLPLRELCVRANPVLGPLPADAITELAYPLASHLIELTRTGAVVETVNHGRRAWRVATPGKEISCHARGGDRSDTGQHPLSTSRAEQPGRSGRGQRGRASGGKR